jgi:hypothetical protein
MKGIEENLQQNALHSAGVFVPGPFDCLLREYCLIAPNHAANFDVV